MKILLDENIPEKLIFDFEEELAVHTTKAMGWNGKKNQHKTIQPLIKKIKDILKTDFENELIEIE